MDMAHHLPPLLCTLPAPATPDSIKRFHHILSLVAVIRPAYWTLVHSARALPLGGQSYAAYQQANAGADQRLSGGVAPRAWSSGVNRSMGSGENWY